MRSNYAHHGPDELRATVSFEDAVEPVASALVDFSRGLGEAPVHVFAPAGRQGDVHVKSAWLPGRAVFTVKVATWFAERARAGLGPGGGIVAVFDARTGDLRALLEDDHHLSDVRTAAAGALATRHMARADARVLGVVGTGVQAYLQALAVIAERPIRDIWVWGRDPERAARLAEAIRARCPNVAVKLAESVELVVRSADVLVTATASTEALILGEWLAPGVHITAVGADDADKCELAPDIFARADAVVVDSRALAFRFGDVAQALRADVITPEAVTAELGELLAGGVTVRARDEEVTVCKLIGLGVQDLAVAELALALLKRKRPAVPPASVLDLQAPLSQKSVKCGSGLVVVRAAEPGDLPVILAITNDAIARTTALFEYEPRTLEQQTTWFYTRIDHGWPVLVAERDGRAIGFGSFGSFRAWPAYQSSVEHSVYVEADSRRSGAGAALLGSLTLEARSRGLHAMIGGIDAKNVASLKLHKKCGFVEVGRLPQVARKFDKWLDLVFVQKVLP